MPKVKPNIPEQAIDASVMEFNSAAEMLSSYAPLTMQIAMAAETIPAWGRNVAQRDQKLREFWPTENTLAGAIYSVCARNSAYKWELEGPDLLIPPLARMLNTAIAPGGVYGWIPFITAVSQDLYTTDNGAFIEVIRESQTSPVLGIAHLDSGQCLRTGDPEVPVIYTDRDGKEHKMKWYQVIPLAELPSPIETMNGVGVCAVTRVLRASQIMLELARYKLEKVSGRFYRAIHIVGGVAKSAIEDVQKRDQENADNVGLARYIEPAIVASLDPEKPVSLETIELASLPDNFDLDVELKWYIAQLALGLGVDYQDFAPLPGGNLGSSAQSEILHRKSRGKGPAWFMETLQNVFHWYGVLPRSVKFKYIEADMAAQLDEARLAKLRAETRSVQILSHELTPQAAREIARRAGDLEDEIVNMMPEENEALARSNAEDPDNVQVVTEKEGPLRRLFNRKNA